METLTAYTVIGLRLDEDWDVDGKRRTLEPIAILKGVHLPDDGWTDLPSLAYMTRFYGTFDAIDDKDAWLQAVRAWEHEGTEDTWDNDNEKEGQ